MIRIRFEIKGVPDVEAAFDDLWLKTLEATGLAMGVILHQVARQERVMLSLGWHPFGTRTGSIPPSPPWRISGALSRSVTVEGPRMYNFVWRGQVGPTSPYGRIHELGGWTGAGYRTYLPPRPHLAPAWAIVRPTVHSTFAKVWEHTTRPNRRL